MQRTPIDAHTARRLNLAMPLERDSLFRAQMASLRETVAWAKEQSPLYRTHLASVEPACLHERQDLERIPFLTEASISSSPLDLLCISQSRISRIITLETSGSTGPPKRLFFTQEDLAATLEFFYEGMLNLITQQDNVLVLLPANQPDSVGDLLLRALSGHGVQISAVWPLPAINVLARTVRETSASCIVGLPQHLLALAEGMPQDSRVSSMLLCSDYAPDAVRQRIETACGCTTFLHYGTTETGLGGGVECGMHRGCHLRESDLLVEIVNPENNASLADGEFGEIVITTLGRRGMPLIRYRTGDLARLDRRKCQCGGTTARLCDIRGRNKPFRLAGGGILFSQDLDDALFGIEGLLDFRARLESGRPESIHIEYLARREYAAGNEIRKSLFNIPAVLDAVKDGQLIIGDIGQIPKFSASHTMKRSILDRR